MQPKQSKTTGLKVFLWFFIGLGALCICIGANLAFQAIRCISWPTTEGTIGTSHVGRHRGNKGGTTYSADVSYNYSVAGSRYTGTKVAIGEMTASSAWAHSVVDHYSIGAKVPVHYSPNDPATAVLETGIHGGTWICFVVGSVFALFGIAFLRSMNRALDSNQPPPANVTKATRVNAPQILFGLIFFLVGTFAIFQGRTLGRNSIVAYLAGGAFSLAGLSIIMYRPVENLLLKFIKVAISLSMLGIFNWVVFGSGEVDTFSALVVGAIDLMFFGVALGWLRKPHRFLPLVLVVFWSATHQITFAAAALPEFAYREISLKFTSADGKPISGASLYGFCRAWNLLWPRLDQGVKHRDDILWDESFLGETGADGTVKARVPPGQWGFFAVGKAEETVVAGWSDFTERSAGDTVRLAPTVTKRWTLCSTNAVFTPKRLFLKPERFPIWISASLPAATESFQMEIPEGNFQLWAEGDAATDHPGFAMNWGTLSSGTADGKLFSPEKSAVVECKGGGGKVSLRWARRQTFGLKGELRLCQNATVLVTPGMFSVGSSRPGASGLRGNFIGQFYNVYGRVALNMETPLVAGLDQALAEPDKKGQSKLFAQLYLVDGNGHILHELFDAAHNPVSLDMAVTLNGTKIKARPVLRSVETPSAGEEEEETETDLEGHMLFAATVGAARSCAGAVWEITSPPGLSQTRLTMSERVTVRSPTYSMVVPRVIARDAQNLLAQAETLAATMNNISGRKRHAQSTTVVLDPSRRGASGGHNGSRMNMSTRLLFSDAPMSVHTMVHETGHNFNFYHGGLHETVVETCRCAGAEQITEQPAKWMFMDRMNGLTREETPYKKYHNVGLYLYCYAQGGLNFLRFLSLNEHAVIGKLSQQGYTTDEVTVALLNLALGHDTTRICRNYGLNFTPERLTQATEAARLLCRRR